MKPLCVSVSCLTDYEPWVRPLPSFACHYRQASNPHIKRPWQTEPRVRRYTVDGPKEEVDEDSNKKLRTGNASQCSMSLTSPPESPTHYVRPRYDVHNGIEHLVGPHTYESSFLSPFVSPGR